MWSRVPLGLVYIRFWKLICLLNSLSVYRTGFTRNVVLFKNNALSKGKMCFRVPLTGPVYFRFWKLICLLNSLSVYRTGFTGNVVGSAVESVEQVVLAYEVAALISL